jgi:hypothetical protein
MVTSLGLSPAHSKQKSRIARCLLGFRIISSYRLGHDRSLSPWPGTSPRRLRTLVFGHLTCFNGDETGRVILEQKKATFLMTCFTVFSRKHLGVSPVSSCFREHETSWWRGVSSAVFL